MAFLTISDEAKIKLADIKYSRKLRTYSDAIIELYEFFKNNHKEEM